MPANNGSNGTNGDNGKNGKNGKNNNHSKSSNILFRFWWVLLLAGFILLILSTPRCMSSTSSGKTEEISHSQFINNVEDGKVASVAIKSGNNLEGVYTPDAEGKEGQKFKTKLVSPPDSDFTAFLDKHDVEFKRKDESNFLGGLFTVFLMFGPVILIFLILMLFMRRRSTPQGGGMINQGRSFMSGRYKALKKIPNVNFADVGGIEEVKEELLELVEFLKNSEKYKVVGAKTPKGVLLVGPPGTGKTLLARAVAGEAGVPFFTASGSDFVEMFVGVGASRVRDLFDTAKKATPCIIFIDEIDALGGQRGSGIGGSHQEGNQTITQLLSEMDGFEPNSGIIIIAATNRPDILDAALLRPGRFDRKIVVRRPGLEGRKQILDIHLRGKPLESSVDIDKLAKKLVGFVGSGIESFVNEAAILAGRKGKVQLTPEDFDEAFTRVLIGPRRKGEAPNKREQELAAYHESGHYLTALYTKGADPPDRVSIIPAGFAGGWTSATPEEDRSIVTESYSLGRIKFALGGRCAEKLIYDEHSSGPHDDLTTATSLAKQMVMQWGMSTRFGPRVFGERSGSFLGRDFDISDYSEKRQAQIDDEVDALLKKCEAEVTELLEEYRHELNTLAKALLEREELSREDIDIILEHAKSDKPPS